MCLLKNYYKGALSNPSLQYSMYRALFSSISFSLSLSLLPHERYKLQRGISAVSSQQDEEVPDVGTGPPEEQSRDVSPSDFV